MQIIARCPVYPTEDQQRVEEAFNNLLPNLTIQTEQKGSTAILSTYSEEQKSLGWLRNQIHTIRIIDAVRARLVSSWDEENSIIQLDKQTAYHGKIRLLHPDDFPPPLGCISIIINFESSTEFENFLSWFTPRTVEGRIAEN